MFEAALMNRFSERKAVELPKHATQIVGIAVKLPGQACGT